MKSTYLLLAFFASLFAMPFMPNELPEIDECCPKTEQTAFDQSVRKHQADRLKIHADRKKKEQEILKIIQPTTFKTHNQRQKKDTTAFAVPK